MTINNYFLRIKQVQEQTALARSTIYKLVSEGDFPQPVKITPKSSAWVSSEVGDWQQARMSERKKIH
jgi:prophage regulatory protein